MKPAVAKPNTASEAILIKPEEGEPNTAHIKFVDITEDSGMRYSHGIVPVHSARSKAIEEFSHLHKSM